MNKIEHYVVTIIGLASLIIFALDWSKIHFLVISLFMYMSMCFDQVDDKFKEVNKKLGEIKKLMKKKL